MLWGVSTGRAGSLSLARELDGVHEPSPGLGPGCDALEVLQGRLERGTPCVDRLQSLLIPQIRQIDDDPVIVWLIRNPFDCVRSMVQTQHLVGPSWDLFPIADEEPVVQACLFWLRINGAIHREVSWAWPQIEIRETESLKNHCGKTHIFTRTGDFGPVENAKVASICGPLWWQLRATYPELYGEKKE